MADIKISEMTVRSALVGTEYFPLIDTTLPVAQQNQRAQIQRILPPGGTTGQLAAKASNTSYDIQWVNPPSPGAGAYSVLNLDFSATEAEGGFASSPVILSTYNMPAATLPATGELIMEAYISYAQSGGDTSEDFADFQIGFRFNNLAFISKILAPYNRGQSGYELAGYMKLECRMQAMNSTSSQYNNAMMNELSENTSDGAFRSVINAIDGQYPPMDTNTSSIDMTAANTIDLVVIRNGTGSANSKLIHRYTRVSLISP